MAKRILIYTNHFFPEQFKINEIVDWLAENGYNIRVITGLPNYPSGKIFKGYHYGKRHDPRFGKNVVINRLLLIPRGNGSYVMLVLNYLSYFISSFLYTLYVAIFKKKYDYIFVHHTSPIFIAIHPAIYSIFHKTKKYLWDLDVWPETLKAVGVLKSKKIIRIIEILMKRIYSNYDAILIGSHSFENIIQKRYKGGIYYFPNWADKTIEKNKIKDFNILSIPDNKFVIMYTGNIGFAQNFSQLISTIKKSNDVHWVFIGSGRFKKQFVSLIENNNLEKNVSLIDHIEVDQIPSYISKADCLFLSLKDEEIFSKTVPAKLQTYMALGKPVIALLKGEGAGIINESKCGFVEEKNDYINLAKIINRVKVLSNEELKLLGQNGKEYYFKNFSREKRKKQLLNLFK